MNLIAKRRTLERMLTLLLLCTLFFLLLIPAHAPPSPHNVAGRVFHIDGSSGVANGIRIVLNNTNLSETVVYTQTSAPPPPQFRGSYSATINGSDNDNITAYSWNSTYYGFNFSNLSTTTTSLNIVLSFVRPAETNVTLLIPQNLSYVNISRIFNITANISIIGGQDAVNCNITLLISNERAINITTDQNSTNQLGDIALGEHRITRWNATAPATGITNITAIARCASDGLNFDRRNTYLAQNITVQDFFTPNVTLLSPANNSRITADFANTSMVYFSFLVSDASPIRNCTLILNGRENVSNSSIMRGIPQTFLQRLSPQNYNWSVNCTDNSTYPSPNYNVSARFNFTVIELTPPIVSNATTLASLDLVAGTTTPFFCNATIFDQNNISDILRVNATLFFETSSSAAIDDNNHHYSNSSCHSLSNSTYYANYSCGFSIHYYANNGTWRCNVSATDYTNSTGSSNRTFRINELLALNVSLPFLDYRSLQATNTSQRSENITLTNIGNVPFNVTVRGYGSSEGDSLAMTCSIGTIPIGNQRYSANSTLAFDAMAPLTNSNILVHNLTLFQRTLDNSYGTSRNSTFWKLRLPSLVQGNCSGNIVIRTLLI